ncbi:MAG: hypothetical protein SFV54_16040 [Bryobacteraceae bacterium]|nr:hypothetical protein [Bryobacteraceae bacterium]
MASLRDDLQRIVAVLTRASVRFEVVGGVAVNVYVLNVSPGRSFVTRDVDLLVHREDLDGIVEVARRAGYTSRQMMGGYLLQQPGQSPEQAVHLLFAGERPRTTHPLPNPEVNPERMTAGELGEDLPVAPLRDLVQMKLNSFRAKDEVHLEILDRCGLLTKELVDGLPPVLRERLEQARARYRPDEDEFEA